MSVLARSKTSHFLIISAITAPHHNTLNGHSHIQITNYRYVQQSNTSTERKKITVTKYSDGEGLTFLRHHQHHLGLVHCHDTDPYNSEALTHRLGKHVATHTDTDTMHLTQSSLQTHNSCNNAAAQSLLKILTSIQLLTTML